jgi:hypothetical protein
MSKKDGRAWRRTRAWLKKGKNSQSNNRFAVIFPPASSRIQREQLLIPDAVRALLGEEALKKITNQLRAAFLAAREQSSTETTQNKDTNNNDDDDDDDDDDDAQKNDIDSVLDDWLGL